ncbi:DUF2974 domain-containing protein [Bifidobacterium hapali]
MHNDDVGIMQHFALSWQVDHGFSHKPTVCQPAPDISLVPSTTG